MMFDRIPAAAGCALAALVLVTGCSGSPTALSPSANPGSATPGGGVPAGRFSLLRPSPIRTLAEFPVSTTGATTTTASSPCTPLPATPGDTEAAPAEEMPATPAPVPYGGYYSLRQGGIHTLEESTAAPTLPCATVQITIAGSIGTAAFDPNPLSAQVGDQIVWANNDLRPHKIIIDDGSLTGLMVGDLLPGATSAPFSLTTPTASFHCEYHPSMVGTINSALPASTPGMPAPASTGTGTAAPAAPADTGYPAPSGYGY
jgi:plastocyanin